MKYRKKPVVIDAVQFDGTLRGLAVVNHELGCTLRFAPFAHGGERGEALVSTLEGAMRASPNDFIIRGVRGEVYPCKPDIFAVTYEPAE